MKYESREEYEKQDFYFVENICPFCTKLDKNRIIFDSKYWFVISNGIPYFDDKNGLMAIPKRHMEFTIDLLKEELVDFILVEKFMKNYYKDKWEYFSFIRQSKANKSIEHIHYHYILWIPHARVFDEKNYFWIEDWNFNK